MFLALTKTGLLTATTLKLLKTFLHMLSLVQTSIIRLSVLSAEATIHHSLIFESNKAPYNQGIILVLAKTRLLPPTTLKLLAKCMTTNTKSFKTSVL